MPNINKEFFDIINQEDWDLDITEEEIQPFDGIIPGIWINLNLGFEIERPEDLDGKEI